MVFNECPYCWGAGSTNLVESETRKYYVQKCKSCGTVIKTPKKQDCLKHLPNVIRKMKKGAE